MEPTSDAGTNRSAGTTEAAEADLQEQARPLADDVLDPEAGAAPREPDGASVEADPADVQEQALEVPDDDEDLTADEDA